QMVPFLRNVLGFSLTLRSPSKFISKGLSQPIILFSYASNNIDSLPNGTKVISDHYMIEHPDISRRVHDNYHKVENEDINVEKVKEHMVDEEIENLVEGTENENVKKRVDDVSISNDDVEEESVGDEFELRMREKGKGIEETKDTPPPTPTRSPRTHISPLSTDKETLQELTIITQDAPSSVDKEKLQELTVTSPTPSSSSPSSSSPKPKTGRFRRYKTFIQQMGERYGYMFAHLKKHFMPKKSFHELARILQSIMEEALPSMVCDQVNEILKKIVLLYVVKGLLLDKQKTQADVAALIAEAVQKERENLHAEITLLVNNAITNSIPSQDDEKFYHDDHHDDARPEGENSVKRQKTSEHRTYSVGESSFEQAMDQEPNPSGSDYKYLNKNDIEDLYMLCVNGKVKDYKETKLLGSLIIFIRSTVIWERVHDFQNSKKEKRVMIYKEIHKFCDATLKRVLEMLKKHNKDVKYGYANPCPSNANAEYLCYYEEEVEERLNHCDQMRRWEIYVNKRPLGSRRDCPE
ncbi:hypothetical protein Tco_1233195, partial [Tanacetum coccineum]